jgi:AWS domain
MTRTTRLSGQLPSPPKSLEGSQSSESNCEVSDNNKTRNNKSHNRSKSDDTMASPDTPKSRVLRRQSTQNVSGEIRAFFAVSTLPTGKGKRDILLAAVDRVSSLYDAPERDHDHSQSASQNDSAITGSASSSSNNADVQIKKHWLKSGLYAGSRTTADNSKIIGKGRKSDPGAGAGKNFKFALPIFHGKVLIDQRRDFKLPWNLYATTGEICKPPNWSRIKRSMFPLILQDLFIDIHVDVDPYDKKAYRPECLCLLECDEACLNRAMFYECDDQNCALDNPADCSNRAFQQAAIRYAEHKARSCGFEVFSVFLQINMS